MNQINISLSDEDYQQLKAEATRKKKSLSAVVKEKIVPKKEKKYSEAEVEKMLKELDELAEENSKDLQGWDSLKALREIRDEN